MNDLVRVCISSHLRLEARRVHLHFGQRYCRRRRMGLERLWVVRRLLREKAVHLGDGLLELALSAGLVVL